MYSRIPKEGDSKNQYRDLPLSLVLAAAPWLEPSKENGSAPFYERHRTCSAGLNTQTTSYDRLEEKKINKKITQQ